MFEPSPAEFVPSQQRGPDVAVYRIPGNTDLCYEWSFKKLLSDKETGSYICCGCRSLKARDGFKYRDPLPLCKIRDGYFVTDPCFPLRPHFCAPRSTPEVAMRRMVIKKCNDLREDTERRPTSSVVDELIGEVSSESFDSDELSDASKQMMVEKLTRMTESASKTLTRVFQWNMQKAQSPAAVPPGEEVKMKCVLCDNEQHRSGFAPIPSKKVATIILLSCLARYNVITLEDAKKHYKELFSTRKRICKNHFIQAVMFLGWEIEQLCGEFPLNGINEASPFVMSTLLTNLRMYRGLLDDTMPMEKKDIREFFNEYVAEFSDEITQRISTPGSTEGELFLQATVNFDIKKEEDSSTQISVVEQLPETTDERDTTSPDFFVPREELEEADQDPPHPTSSASSSDEGDAIADLELKVTCALCSVQRRSTQLRASSKINQRNIIFLTCMLIKKVITEEAAIHLYKEFKRRTQKRCCKQHYVEAGMTLQEELKKSPECLPNEARVPRFIPSQLIQLLQEKGSQIGHVILQARDVALFYSDCLNKYHNGKEWELEERNEAPDEPPDLENPCVKSTSRARKRRHEDVVEEPTVETKTLAVQPVASDAGGSDVPKTNNKDQGTCVICCCTRNKIEFCRTSRRVDQHLILLSCLVLNGSFKTEVARVMLQEMIKEAQFICRKHYMLAMLYIYKSIKEKWNQSASWSFFSLPEYIKMDLVDRIRECANEIQKGFSFFLGDVQIQEEFLEKFYNSCETKYCVIGRLLAREGAGEPLKDAVCDALQDGSYNAVAENKRSHCTVKSRYKKAAAERVAMEDVQFPSPRWLIQRKRPETKRASLLACGLCGCVRLWVDVRKASAKAGRTNVLLACLIRQGLIDLKTAENFHKDCERSQKRMCHEHFIHAGAYLASAVQTLTGQYPILGLWNVPFDIMDNIVITLQEHLELISYDTLIAHDVASFFNDYLLKYVETEEWKIAEVSLQGNNFSEVIDSAPRKVNKQRRSSTTDEKHQGNVVDEQLFSNSVEHQDEDSELFCKVERDEKSSITVTEELGDANEPNQSSNNQDVHPESAAEQPLSSEASADHSWRTRCGVCDYRGVTGLRKPPISSNYKIILLACMIMDRAIDVSEATDLFWKLTYFSVLICEKHFFNAVLRIRKELTRIWGREPSDALDDVPCSEMYQFLEIIKAYGHRIDINKKTVIKLTDIKNFYDLCQMFYVAYEMRKPLEGDTSDSSQIDETSQDQIASCSKEKSSDPSNIADSLDRPNFDECDGASSKEHLNGSAVDEACGAQMSFHEEIPATALLEQPIPHVDQSLGTSGTNTTYDASNAFSEALSNITESIDFRPIALFHFRQGYSVQTTTAEIIATFGENSVTERKVKAWFEMFRTKHAQIAASAITPQAQAQNRLMKALLEADPNKTVPQLAQEFGASVDAILNYLRMSGMLRNVRRTVLSERQRRNRMEICSGLILRQKREPTFLHRLITYGEVWMSNSFSEKRENVMAAVWWSSCGVIHHHLVPSGGRMTAQLYFYHVTEMHKKLLKTRREIVEQQGMIMLHDTRLPYISLGAIRNLHQLGYEILPFPANSSDLLPTDFHFVPQLRLFMADRVCSNDVELEKCINDFIDSKDVQFYVSGIFDLVSRWRKCFNASGDYFKT